MIGDTIAALAEDCFITGIEKTRWMQNAQTIRTDGGDKQEEKTRKIN